MVIHETDIRFIFKQLRDMNSRIAYLEKTLKEMKKSSSAVDDMNEEWREPLDDGDPEE